MRRHGTLLLLVCIVVIAGMTAGIALAGAAPPQKPTKPGGGKGGGKGGGGGGGGTGTPVTVSFDDAAGDAILSDGLGSYAAEFVTAVTIDGFEVTSALKLSSSTRKIQLSFASAVDACPAPADTSLFWSSWPVAFTSIGSLGVVPLDAHGVPLADGFLGMTPGETLPARLKINFNDPDGRKLHGGKQWTVRKNAAFFPCSDDVLVTREAANPSRWRVEAVAGISDRATLIRSGLRANGGDEGTYAMGFAFTVSQ